MTETTGKIRRQMAKTPEEIREYKRQYYLRNREQILAKNKAWAQENPEKVSEIARRYREKDPEKYREMQRRSRDKPEFIANKKAYEAANRDKARARWRKWRDANPERDRFFKDRWRKANPERWTEYNATRRSLLRGVEVEKVDRAAIYDRDGGKCHICGERVPRDAYDLDHLIPLSHGGPHTAANLAVSHRFCNRSRGAGRLPAQLRLVG